MSRWCNSCVYGGRYNQYPCDNTCIIFGKDFEELAELVIELEYENKKLKECKE